MFDDPKTTAALIGDLATLANGAVLAQLSLAATASRGTHKSR